MLVPAVWGGEMSDDQVWFSFESSALDPDTFQVVRFTGEEAISRPFRFEIELASARSDIDLSAPLGRMASFGLRQEGGQGERKIHGIVSAFEQRCTALEEEAQLYRAVLVPRLWQLSLGYGSRIHQGLSYPEIIERQLLAEAERGPASVSAADLSAEDVSLALSRAYPQREYTVQYNESDLDFLTRLMEHEGIYFAFEQGETKERLIVTDDNGKLPMAGDALKLTFRPPYLDGALAEAAAPETDPEGEAEPDAADGEEGQDDSSERQAQVGVWTFSSARRQSSHRLILQDGGEGSPERPPHAQSAIDDRGRGVVALHGEAFDGPEEGEALAGIRAEELLCAGAGHSGESNCIFVSAGRSVALTGHPRPELDRSFLVTAVKHEGWQSRPGVPQSEEEAESFLSYVNAFTAIPSDLPYRSARVTAKPRIDGLLRARIDAEGPGTRAEIDEQGRYKLVMPFDLSGAGDGQATLWVRMAQPYAGAQHGMSFPLLKGTEVAVAFVEGDPDRPIIVGAVPSARQPSVVTRDSRTANRIVTAGGIAMEWQDGPAKGEG